MKEKEMRRYGPKPKKAADKQSKGIMVRLTPGELEQVQAAARIETLRPATYARQSVLKAAREVKE